MTSLVSKQHTSGYTIGAGRGSKVLVTLLSLALVGYNAVHLHDYALVMFVNDDTWLIKEIAIRVAAVGIAFLEVIIGGVFVYLYRTTEYVLNPALFLTGFLALVVASMSVIAGNGSQQSKADVKTNHINAYESTLTANQNQLESAAVSRDIALRQANQIKDANRRALAKDWANLDYADATASLNNQRSKLQSSRPIQPIQNGSTFHYIAITSFSILCSFGALFLSGYSAAFLNPLVAAPVIKFARKLQHSWNSDGSDFQTVKHQVSPISGVFSTTGSTSHNAIRAPQEVSVDSLSIPSNNAQSTPPHVAATGNTLEKHSSKRLPDNSGKVEYSESHYSAIKQAILNTEIKPTQAPVRKKLTELKVSFVDDAARQKKAIEILERLKSEGVLVDNPQIGNTKKMVALLVLNPDYKASEEKQPEQGADNPDVECTCPKCGEVGLVEKSVLEKSKGKIRCGCGVVYSVKEGSA